MFEKRIEKTDMLKPVTIMWKNHSITIDNFEKLSQLMEEAVENDLANVKVMPGGENNIRAQATDVERLKQEIFKAYLIQTKDFQESIYGTGQTSVVPPEETTPGNTEPEKPGSPETEQPGGTGGLEPGQPGQPDSSGTEQPGGSTGLETGKKNSSPKLLFCKVSSGKTSHTLRWNLVKSADGYIIFGAVNINKV